MVPRNPVDAIALITNDRASRRAISAANAIDDGSMCRCGGTFIDTADVYSRGASEEIVGRWLKRQRRDDLVIMTKVRSGTRIEIAEEQGWSKFWSVYNNEHTWNLLDALFAVAEEMGKTPAQLAINWLLQRPGVTPPMMVRARLSN